MKMFLMFVAFRESKQIVYYIVNINIDETLFTIQCVVFLQTSLKTVFKARFP